MVVDAAGVDVGVIEFSTGLVPRTLAGGLVLLPVGPQGFAENPITFFHTTTDCSGDRYLGNNGGAFAYLGQLSGGTVYFTTLAEPLLTPTESISSYEVLGSHTASGMAGECTTMDPPMELSVGKAIPVTDPAINAFTPPFRLR